MLIAYVLDTPTRGMTRSPNKTFVYKASAKETRSGDIFFSEMGFSKLENRKISR